METEKDPKKRSSLKGGNRAARTEMGYHNIADIGEEHIFSRSGKNEAHDKQLTKTLHQLAQQKRIADYSASRAWKVSGGMKSRKSNSIDDTVERRQRNVPWAQQDYVELEKLRNKLPKDYQTTRTPTKQAQAKLDRPAKVERQQRIAKQLKAAGKDRQAKAYDIVQKARGKK